MLIRPTDSAVNNYTGTPKGFSKANNSAITGKPTEFAQVARGDGVGLLTDSIFVDLQPVLHHCLVT